ncbi:MAG: hypothetical protein HKN25_01470 [Pyrinomonadaceae bacterium]|nr:hypothetical protein [Pyrinomonadaceae bacterium]
MDRREFGKSVAIAGGVAGIGLLGSCAAWETAPEIEALPQIPKKLSESMYAKALQITKEKVRGGDTEVFFKKPFIDAAFSKNIFLWDTCFMACFSKYHLETLPVYQALDNFYERADDDGYICREYRQDGRPVWRKDHPVSINPPLMAFAELEIYSVSRDLERSDIEEEF